MANMGDIAAGGASVYVDIHKLPGFRAGLKKIYSDLQRLDSGSAKVSKSMSSAVNSSISMSTRAARGIGHAIFKSGAGFEYIGGKIKKASLKIDFMNKRFEGMRIAAITAGYKTGLAFDAMGRRIRIWGAEAARVLTGFRNQVTLMAKRTGQWLRVMGVKWKTFGAQLASVGRQMAVLSIVMAVPFVAGAKTFGKFSKEMAFVSTMIDDTEKYMGKYTAGIRRMSVEFGEGTDTLARGLYDVLSAGFAADKALEMLHITAMSAKAGMTDTAQSTRAIVAVLNSYSLGAEHAAMVSDKLFMTVRKGNLTFEELAGNVGMVAASAAQMGLTIDELGTSLAVITRGGLSASSATIALQNMLKAFSSPTGEGAEFLQQLKDAGMDLEMTLAGIKSKGFLNVFKDIAKLPTEGILKVFAQIRGQRGALSMKAGIADIDEILAAHQKSSNAMKEAYDKVNKSFGFLMDRVKQAGILIMSYIGEALAKRFTHIGERVLYVAMGFGEWVKQNTDVIAGLAKTVGYFAQLAIALYAVGKAIAFAGMMTAIFSGTWAGIALTLGAGLLAWEGMNRAIDSAASGLSKMAKMGEEVVSSDNQLTTLLQQLLAIRAKRDALAAIWENPGSIMTGAGVHNRMSGLGDQIKALDLEAQKVKKLISKAHENLKIDKERLAVAKATTDAISKQARIVMGSMGQMVGYWHTPALTMATGNNIDVKQLDVMTMINKNTGEDGAIVKAIGNLATT